MDRCPYAAKNAQGPGTFTSPIAAYQQQRQHRCAADMEPMALSPEPNSGLVTADNWCSTQLIGDAHDESIKSH
jgi:hypothetical protein